MKYVCDLWIESGSAGSSLSPYGYFIFDYEKFPTVSEVGRVLIDNLPLLKNNHIDKISIVNATPCGRKTKEPHPVSVYFEIDGNKEYLSYTNVRPVVEDKPIDKMNLYT